MIFRVRKKSTWEWLVLFALFMPFAFFLLMDLLHLPSVVKYAVDIAWMGLLIGLFKHRKPELDANVSRLAIIAGLFFLLTLVGFFLNYQSPLYYLWGIRNNARFFVYFFACVFFLKERSVKYYLRFFDVLFWVNFPVVLYQFLFLGKMQDYLGGVFGVEKGCNAYMAIFLSIVVAKSILYYMNDKEQIGLCFLKCAVALLVAVLSEMKFFFVLFVVILVMATVITKFSSRKLWVVLGAGIGVWIAVEIMVLIFPEYADWFNLKSMWETATSTDGYTSSGDMNRLTTVSIALKRFLPSRLDKLFGLGLGNCDYSSSFNFLVTPFYQMYSELNYVWFSSAFLILETGLVGLSLYVAFFVFLFVLAGKRKRIENANPLYCQLAQIMAVISVIMVVYNSSMRTEAAYMLYFVLALPFIQLDSQPVKQSVPVT